MLLLRQECRFCVTSRPSYSMSSSYHYLPVDERTVQTGCYLTSIGVYRHPAGTPYPPFGHPESHFFHWGQGRRLSDFGMVVCMEGAGDWECETQRCQIRAGDAVCIAPGSWHRYRPSIKTGWTERWICLRGATVHEYARLGAIPLRSTMKPKALRSIHVDWIDSLFEDVLTSPGENRISWGPRALSILMDVCEQKTRAKHDDSEGMGRSLAMAAGAFIHQNCHRDISVSDVAQACNCSRRTLERHLANAGREAVALQIARARLERAETLLLTTSLPVKSIAFDVGFGSAHRLIQAFHRFHNCTPGEFRLNCSRLPLSVAEGV
jgi:AraC-like DNA-binding protein